MGNGECLKINTKLVLKKTYPACQPLKRASPKSILKRRMSGGVVPSPIYKPSL